MTKEMVEYLQKIVKVLKDKTGIAVDINMLYADAEKSQYRSTKLDDYNRTYTNAYRQFMTANARMSGTISVEKQVENFVCFNRTMQEYFETFIDRGRGSYEKQYYLFGNLSTNEIRGINNDIYREVAQPTETPLMTYLSGSEVRVDSHFDFISDAFLEEKQALAEMGPDAVRNNRAYVAKLLPIIAVMKQHYDNRSIFSQWFTPNGWRESSLLNSMANTLYELTGDPVFQKSNKKVLTAILKEVNTKSKASKDLTKAHKDVQNIKFKELYPEEIDMDKSLSYIGETVEDEPMTEEEIAMNEEENAKHPMNSIYKYADKVEQDYQEYLDHHPIPDELVENPITSDFPELDQAKHEFYQMMSFNRDVKLAETEERRQRINVIYGDESVEDMLSDFDMDKEVLENDFLEKDDIELFK